MSDLVKNAGEKKGQRHCHHDWVLDFVGHTQLSQLYHMINLLPRQAMKTPAAKIALMLMIIQGAFKPSTILTRCL
jgi:hypothetical protein